MEDEKREQGFTDTAEHPEILPLDLNSPTLHNLRRRVEPNKVSILIADDDRLFVEGISALIEQWEEFDLVAKAHTNKEALQYARDYAPAIILLGVRIGGASSVSTIEDILFHNPETRIMMLASSGEAYDVLRALRAGAMGYGVRDEMSADRFRGLIWGVVSGEVILSGSIGTRIKEELIRPGSLEDDSVDTNRINILTVREREILALLMEGKSNTEIAHDLHLSEPTIKKNVSRINDKLLVENRVQAAVYAARHLNQ